MISVFINSWDKALERIRALARVYSSAKNFQGDNTILEIDDICFYK